MMHVNDYGAMEFSGLGQLRWVRRPRPLPGYGEVLLQVEACGMCGADVSDIARPDAQDQHGLPGHEVVGRILEVGEGVPDRWYIGHRVGVGRLGGPCNACSYCRQGRFALCTEQDVLGVTRDGGYAELMLMGRGHG
ncbi:TPA: alcohol dehydrogenase catalytic domain-containing protein [Stenotrophomonas maltophilia]|uniref:alcohol dehydrogenase catalytic domain-containing protein n=1 Tax=Stenotrophomonas maltophilia TaxID=40324 RepID=UPI001F52C215|nr:alcohol dehydrogenase catalytic domain-containing protein [Stenotrophomonas maltophilia]